RWSATPTTWAPPSSTPPATSAPPPCRWLRRACPTATCWSPSPPARSATSPSTSRRAATTGPRRAASELLALPVRGARGAAAAPRTAALAELGDAQAEEGALHGGGGLGDVGVAAALLHELLGAAPRLLGAGLVDVLGALGGVGEDHHLVGQDLEEAAGDEEELLAIVVAHQHLAGA